MNETLTVSTDELPEHLRIAAGVAEQDIPRTVDYFDVQDTVWVYLPDGVQRVELKVLTEGERRKYLNQTNRDIKMNSKTKELHMRSAAGDDERTLVEISTVGWDVQRGGSPMPFSKRSLELALENWPPSAWKPVLKRIREINEWLAGDEDSLEAMEEEYADLGERIAKIKENSVKSFT